MALRQPHIDEIELNSDQVDELKTSLCVCSLYLMFITFMFIGSELNI